MEHVETQSSVGYLAQRLAPEDIRPGRYVAILYVIGEHEPMFFELESLTDRVIELPRFRRMPHYSEPMEVLDVCLPFVLVKRVDGEPVTLDVRRLALAGVSARFGREAFERHKAAKKAREDKDKKDDDD